MAESVFEQLLRLRSECSVCVACGHVQADPTWCHECNHRVTMPGWAAELVSELFTIREALEAMPVYVRWHMPEDFYLDLSCDDADQVCDWPDLYMQEATHG